jgi:hypothetical protein
MRAGDRAYRSGPTPRGSLSRGASGRVWDDCGSKNKASGPECCALIARCCTGRLAVDLLAEGQLIGRMSRDCSSLRPLKQGSRLAVR